MIHARFPAAIFASLVLCAPLTASARDADKTAGDLLQFAIPAAALTTAWLKDDELGQTEWLRNSVASVVMIEVSKTLFNQTSLGERPNGGKGSFPSGHVAFAASGAAFLTERYGWAYGIPAYALVAYVGNTRVVEDEHHWRDVIAGAALSYGLGRLFVTPENATQLAPVIGSDFIGLRWERSF